MLHDDVAPPSEWVERWAHIIPARGRVLDVASGSGRHARWLADHGYEVDAVDRNANALANLAATERVHPVCADIENGPWPFARGDYSGVIVTNYLHRPIFPNL